MGGTKEKEIEIKMEQMFAYRKQLWYNKKKLKHSGAGLSGVNESRLSVAVSEGVEEEGSNPMQELSKMQKKIYDFIAACIREQGYAPSVREIGEAVELKSPSTVHFHLKHLMEAGYIEKGAGKGRAIALTHRQTPPVQPSAVQPASAPEPAGDRVPIVGNVAAGSPILAEECIEDYLTFDTGGRGEEYFALRVRGESMINAGILSGDLVVVRRQQVANNGEIVVALLEDEATVKRFSRKDGHTWLLPENDAYAPIDGTYARILGKVAAVVRRY